MTVSPAGSGVVTAAACQYNYNDGKYTLCDVNKKTFPPEITVDCYNYLDYMEIKATPNSGYQFSGWRISGATDYSGTANPYIFRLPKYDNPAETNVIAYFTGGTTPPPDAEAVNLDTAKAKVDSARPVIVIDVREPLDYKAGHIICAYNYPWTSGVLEKAYTDFNRFKDYDILVYGKARSPGDDAADFLAGKGFSSIYHMIDGMDGWQRRGWPTVDDDCEYEICSLPPMAAHAGPDQTVNEGNRVTLNGSGSSVAGGFIKSYQWKQVGGVQTVILSDETSAKPTFTAPYVQQGGDTLVFHLIVTSDNNQKDTDSVSIHVQWIDSGVSADAGPDQSVMAGDTVTLDGSGSKAPNGAIASYRWELFSAFSSIDPAKIVLSNPSGPRTTFTAPDAKGWIQFRLTVTDTGGSQDSDMVMITINTTGGDTGLSADAGPDQMVAEGSTVMLNGSWTTSLDAVVRGCQWIKILGPRVVLSGSDAMAPESTPEINPAFTAPLIGSGQAELIFKFIVKDTKGATATDAMKVIVNSQAYINDNKPPVADAGPDQDVTPGAVVTLDGSGSRDPEGKIFSYKWTIGAGSDVSIPLPDSASVQPTFIAPYASGSAIFQLMVTDDAGKTDLDTVQVRWLNASPVADAGPDQNVYEKETVLLNGSGSFDPDDGIATYQWRPINGFPVDLSDNALANSTFTAPARSGPDPTLLIFELTVTDHSGQASTDRVTVTVHNKNEPPVANAGRVQRVNETALVHLDGSASSDPDGDPLTFEWRQLSGPAVSLSDALISNPTFRTPSIGVTQARVIMQLTITDTEGQADADRVEIVIDDVGNVPIAVAGADTDIYEKRIVTLDGSGSKDHDGIITRYLWTQTSGPTVIVSDVSAIAPTFAAPAVNPDVKVLTFRLMVEDDDGLLAFDEVTITVKPSTEPPVADAGPDQTVFEREMVILDASGSRDTDDGIASYQWTQVSGTGVVLSDNSSVKPTFEAPKINEPSVILSFRLTVEDVSGQARDDFVEITVMRKSGGGGCFISSIN